MAFDFTCPSCGEMIAVADEHRGWTMRCPICQGQFQAGESSAPTASTPPRWKATRSGPPRAPEAAHEDDQDNDHDDDLDDLPIARARVNREEAIRVVSGPSWFLEIMAWLHMVGIGLCAAFMVIVGLDANQNGGGNDDDVGLIVFVAVLTVIMLPYFAVMAYGARKMRSLSNFSWAMASSILGTVGLALCGCGGILMAAAGIWALVVINRPEIRRAFENQENWRPS